ncbi:MAG: 30S ribosomal protein S4 [archaeon]
MGDPRRLDRLYDVPRKIWDKARIIQDRKIMNEFGLKTKSELWKAETDVRNLRKRARQLLAGNIDNSDSRTKEIVDKLYNLGILPKDSKVEDVLKLDANDYLERRLQTLVFRRGLALTATQARQLITHGHIAVNGKKRTSPGSLILLNEIISYNNTKMKNIIEKSSQNKGRPVLDKKKVEAEATTAAAKTEDKKVEEN